MLVDEEEEVVQEGAVEGVEEGGKEQEEEYQRDQRNRTAQAVASSPDGDESDNQYECPACGCPEDGIDPWIGCDSCNQCFHIHCTNVDQDCDLDEPEWECCDCSFSWDLSMHSSECIEHSWAVL